MTTTPQPPPIPSRTAKGPYPVAACRSCGSPLVWAITEAKDGKGGKRIPVDADPTNPGYPAQRAGGNLLFTGGWSGDGTPIVRYAPKAVGRYVSHFATCAQADKWRRR